MYILHTAAAIATQHQGSEDGSMVFLLDVSSLPASDLERWADAPEAHRSQTVSRRPCAEHLRYKYAKGAWDGEIGRAHV